MNLAEGTGTLDHVETIPMKVCGRAPECSLAGPNHVCTDLIHRHSTPLATHRGTLKTTVSIVSAAFLTSRQL